MEQQEAPTYEAPTVETLGSLVDLTLGSKRRKKHPRRPRSHGFSS